jgi:hypothetical protein
MFGVITIGLAGCVWWLSDNHKPQEYPSRSDLNGPPVILPKVNAEISVSLTNLRVVNMGPSSWSEYTIWLNGASGYRFTGHGLGAGSTAEIELIRFVDRDSNRFQPLAKGVRDVMVSVPGMTELYHSR